jgi:hypothetical protein
MNRSEGAVKLLVFRAVSNMREALADVARDQAKPKPRRRRKEVKGA